MSPTSPNAAGTFASRYYPNTDDEGEYSINEKVSDEKSHRALNIKIGGGTFSTIDDTRPILLLANRDQEDSETLSNLKQQKDLAIRH